MKDVAVTTGTQRAHRGTSTLSVILVSIALSLLALFSVEQYIELTAMTGSTALEPSYALEDASQDSSPTDRELLLTTNDPTPEPALPGVVVENDERRGSRHATRLRLAPKRDPSSSHS